MPLGGPLTAFVVLAVLVWVGMGVSTATLLQRAEVPALRAWTLALVAWPAVLFRIRRLED
jgi:hypothetical protein